jgi:hypothetical protein
MLRLWPSAVGLILLCCASDERRPSSSGGALEDAGRSSVEPSGDVPNLSPAALDVTVTRALCRTEDDCESGQRCCTTGAVGVCEPFSPDYECARPDLTVLAPRDWGPEFVERVFEASANDCAVVDGCVRGPGPRRLMRFSIEAINLGNADMILGPAGTAGVNRSTCTQALLADDFLRYELLAPDGALIIRSSGRASHCAPRTPGAPILPFRCDVLGLARRSYDVFSSSEECQWLDVTGVDAGDYTLRVTINPGGTAFESDAANNSLDLPVRVPERDPLVSCEAPPATTLPDQLECGWTRYEPAELGSCTPGESVVVACSICNNLPVLRLCEGPRPCSALGALDVTTGDLYRDGAGPTPCTTTASDCVNGLCVTSSFTCPSSGVYTLLSHPGSYGESISDCRLARPQP